ncbi:tripartite tricarboxylate transporter substrate binding protein [Roseomonas alkaliterrae]|uniref:Tripartite-type tricarboxylate transporter receptor subunit TctC n=1 Tax=Neoroseomonas alkaliterrae TaxID=1452450 RepID=A0A840XQ36_9PROT|nr:tripartite tricarboxylate transporter substrate-binding protein [Neoroseomonas alkaliterrae]MBB5690026.1 tripartite-type tricarboxylate transporter receptor subunit TctC [Neoroseomonas alkaliterrae]MBR0677923.1 tripartite tricarboxylate transporter substrate binding protein [Neoroseomonas alkaliterrae]
MTLRRRQALAAALGLLPAPGFAQQARALTLVVPFAPGGTTDIGARIIAARLGAHLGGQSVVVENRAGAGGATAADHVRRQPADGTTLLIGTASTHAVNPAVFTDLPYDPIRDFAPVALLGVTGFVLVVPAASGITDMAGLVARLRAEPGRHNFASAGVGSMPHLAGEWFAKGAGVRVEHVAYRGGGPALQALLTGEVTFMVESAPTVAAAIADGRLRALARASLRRSGPQADLPAIADMGIPGFDAETWILAFAPAGTPGPVVARLNAAFNATLAEPEVSRRLGEVGTVAVADSTPESAAAFVRNEAERWRRVVAETGVRITRQ